MPSFTVEYTALHFQAPIERISERHFNYYKQQFLKDNNFKFYTPAPYWGFMKANYIVLAVSALLAWRCKILVIDNEPPSNETLKDIITVTLVLSGFIAFYMSYNVSAKHISYMKYKKDLNEYYERMKASIIKANSYESFVGDFYKK